MNLKNLTKKLSYHKMFFPYQSLRYRISSIDLSTQKFSFSKAKIRQVKNFDKNQEISPNHNQQKNELSKDYMKIILNNHNRKISNIHVNVLLNLKVTFPQQGNKQTKITKIQTLEQSNEPCVIMALDKSQFPPEANKANEEIQRFCNKFINENWDSKQMKIISDCQIVSGKTSKRKNIAFTLQSKHKTNISLMDILEELDAFLKSSV